MLMIEREKSNELPVQFPKIPKPVVDGLRKYFDEQFLNEEDKVISACKLNYSQP